MSEGSVGIVGAGAVGQMLAFGMQSVGVSAIVYGRRGVEAMDQTVLDNGQRKPLKTKLSGDTPCLWLFATKAYDIRNALLEKLPGIDADVPVVLLCNGFIEPEMRSLREKFPRHKIRKGVVSRGARFHDDGSLALSPKGDIRWGSQVAPSAWEKQLLHKLEGSGYTWDADSCARRKEKWFCNTVLNTVCGVYALPRNRDAADDHHEELVQLSHEVFQLGLELWPEWAGQEFALNAKLKALIAMTADNENSMARDIRLGRKTEADYLSGHVLSASHAAQRFPLLYALHSQLQPGELHDA